MKIMGSFYRIHNQTLHIIIILPFNLELIVLKISLFYFLEQFLIPLNLCSQTWAHIYISQSLLAQQNKRDFHVTNVFRRFSLCVDPILSLVVIQYFFFFSSITTSLKMSNSTKFPGGPVVKNLPTNAGDMGSIPGSGRSHMPWGN